MKQSLDQREVMHGKRLAASDAEGIWGWGSPAGQVRAQRRAKMIMESARLGAESKVLEIGCGTGLFTEYFARSGARLIAVDISRELIGIAQRRGLARGRVQFLAESFEACLLEDSFDAVIGSSVLHHLNIRPALRKIYQVLKPGGRISFAEPNILNPQIMLQKNIPCIKARLGDTPDEIAFSSWQMRSLLEEIGFTDIFITPFDWLHPAVPKVFIGPVSRFGLILERIPVLKAFAGSLHVAACRPFLHLGSREGGV